MKINYLFIVALLCLLASCAPKNEAAGTITLLAKADGPFFSGPNSLIAEYEVDFSSANGLADVSKDKIKEIKLISASVELMEVDSVNFDFFQSAALQMVSPDAEMQMIAIKNPITVTGRKLAFEISEDADIVEFFKGKNCSFVLDLDFKEDSYDDTIGATIEMEINVKYN